MKYLVGIVLDPCKGQDVSGWIGYCNQFMENRGHICHDKILSENGTYKETFPKKKSFCQIDSIPNDEIHREGAKILKGYMALSKTLPQSLISSFRRLTRAFNPG